METIVAALAEQHAELAGLISGLDEAGWQRPSACEGWTVADVVLHLAQSDAMALASAQGRFTELVEEMGRDVSPANSVDESVDQMVARERGQPGHVVGERWRQGADELRRVLSACDPHQRIDWVAGQLSVHTMVATRLAETWIHTGDVAAAFGIAPAPADRLRHIARLAWRTLPYAFALAGRELSGPVAFELQGPDGHAWNFVPDQSPVTTIRGDALELCLVAGRRALPSETGLGGEGPDVDAVLELVRTYA